MSLIGARIALLRHGHTAWNRAGRIQGRIDVPLDDQALDHLSHLRLPDGFEDFALFSSPLVRAVETARIVTQRQPSVAPELVEMDWGRWEGSRGVDLLADVNSGYRHIEGWGWDFQPPGGETPRQVWARVEPWLLSLRGGAVVVCHIGIMRVILARATGWNFDATPPFRIKRDRLYRVEVCEDGVLSYTHEPVRLIRVDGS